MAESHQIKVNGRLRRVQAEPGEPLLYALTGDLGLKGPRFGCGLAQCGYCYNGMIIKATELLTSTPHPTEPQIRAAMNGHLCRCGTYPRIVKAIQRAAEAQNGVKA